MFVRSGEPAALHQLHTKRLEIVGANAQNLGRWNRLAVGQRPALDDEVVIGRSGIGAGSVERERESYCCRKDARLAISSFEQRSNQRINLRVLCVLRKTERCPHGKHILWIETRVDFLEVVQALD